MTTEQSQNVLSWKDPQGSSEVTNWITVPSDTIFILAKCLSCTPTAPTSVICVLSLPQNPGVVQSQSKPKPKTGNYTAVIEATVQQRKQNCHVSKKSIELQMSNSRYDIWRFQFVVHFFTH